MRTANDTHLPHSPPGPLPILSVHQGVQIPTVGTFHVVKALDAFLRPAGTVRPFFFLLEGRFNSVPQFKGWTFPASRGTIVPPSYNQVGRKCGLDRIACQRVLREMLALLGAEIRAKKAVKIAWPEVGSLFTNKDGRVQFTFDKGLVLEVHDKFAAPKPVKALLKAAEDGRGSADAIAELATLKSMCAAADRVGSRCMARLQFEELLYTYCKQALAALDARTVMSMLSAHVFGKSGKFVNWVSYCEDLERHVREAVGAVRVRKNTMIESDLTVEDAEVEHERAREGGRATEGHGVPHAEEGDEAAAEEARATAAAGGDPFAPSDAGAFHYAAHPAAPALLPSDEPDYYANQRPQTAPTRALPSRADCDSFNRLHFDKLYKERGWKEHAKREVTPKVGEDQRNVQAAAALVSRSVNVPRPVNVIAQALDDQVHDRAVCKAATKEAELRAARERNQRAADQAEAEMRAQLERKRATVAALKAAWAEQGKVGVSCPALTVAHLFLVLIAHCKALTLHI